MASDRVELFLDSCQTLITKLNNNKKIISEISKLCTWLQKHQNEEITDAAKGKMIIIIEKYYLYYKNSNNNNNDNDSDIVRLEDTIEKLLSDYLALPEGKLVTGKFKQKVMNWQSSMQQQNNVSSNADNNSNNNNNIERWIICDINDNKITLMKPDSNINDEIIDDVTIDDSNILKIINNIYNQEESSNYIQVDYDKKLNTIIKLYDENGNELLNY